MSYRVKVFNKGSVDIRERFKGAEINIKAGEFVEMDRDEAVEFSSQYRPIITDGEMNLQPSGFKKLAFEPGLYGHQTKESLDDLICHANGKRAMNKEELRAMIRQNAHLLADDEAKDALRDEMKAEVAEMKAEILAEVKGRSGKGPKNAPKPEGNNPQG